MPLTPLTDNITTDLYFPDENYNALETLARGVVKGFLNVGGGLVGTAESALRLTPWIDEDNYLNQVRANIRAEESEWETNPDNKAEWVASVLGQALPYMGAALTGHAAAGLAGSAAVGFAVEGQDAYESALARGATEGQAQKERAIVGTLNAGIEALQMGRLMKFANKGKFSFNAFRKAVKDKAYDKVAMLGGNFTKEVLLNSIEEAGEEFIQEGVALTVPYFIEGREQFDDLSLFRHLMNNKEQLGAAALGGAVVSPFLGMARAAIPALAGPQSKNFSQLKERVQESNLPTEQKAAYLRDISIMEEKALGEVSEAAQEIHPQNQVEQKKHMDMTDRLQESINYIEENRVEHEAKIKKERAERFGEVKNFNEAVLNDSNLSVDQKVATIFSMMKGTMGIRFTPLLEQGWTSKDYDRFRESAMSVHRNNAPALIKSLKAFQKLFVEGQLPEPNEIKSLEPVLGKRFVRDTMSLVEKLNAKPKTFGQKILGQIKETFNFPRAVLASLDFSAIGRQGALMAFFQPKAWMKGIGASYRAFFNEDYSDFIDLSIRTHPDYELLKTSGVFLSDTGRLNQSEEYFASSLAHRIPGVKASERAYVTALNTMRAHAFYSIKSKWSGTGKEFDLPKLAKVLNHITGRGDLGSLKKLAPALNIMFFAPKLQVARIQTLTDLIPKIDGDGKTFSPAQRMLGVALAEALGTGLMVLWLLGQREGVSVEYSPKSSDFGKVKIGDTRIDFWGGYSQIMRLVAQLASGERKSTSTGEIYGVDTLDTVARFLQTKLSPTMGMAVDAYRGEDFKGDIIEPTLESGSKQFYQRFTPLFLQDTADVLYYQGLTGGSILTSGLALHGIGAMTYPISESGQTAQLKNHYSQQMFGENWSELGPLAQQTLRTYYTDIAEQERRSRQERLSKKAKARTLNEIRSSERRITRSLPKDVRKELDRLLVPVGGLSRRLSEDWYLNDTKYKQYELKTSDILNKVLPRFTSLKIAPEIKRIVIEEAINRIKKGVRQQIVNQAKFEDLKRFNEMS